LALSIFLNLFFVAHVVSFVEQKSRSSDVPTVNGVNIHHLLLALFLEINFAGNSVFVVSTENFGKSLRPAKKRSSMDWRVSKLRQFIDSHTGALGWSLDYACKDLELWISPAYAAQLFKRQIGLGIREYAKTKRLLIAAERLTTTDEPIKVIAAECGYRDRCDFNRSFKEHYRVSPTTFRRQNGITHPSA
jgi:AraC-like DNA-binding protein